MKKLLLILLLSIAFIMMGMIYYFGFYKTNLSDNTKLIPEKSDIPSFDANDSFYARAIDDFPSDKLFGEVQSAECAVEYAAIVWIEKFGKDYSERRPFQVFFDKKEDIWLIKGSSKTNNYEYGFFEKWVCERIPYAMIRKSDGKVLAVWGC